jgi:gas vesicle protein
MPIIPYLFSLLTALLTALWAFLSVWLEEFILGFLIDYLINMLIQFIKDELLQPIEDWAKGLIDDIAIGIKEKIDYVFNAIDELIDTFNFFICDKFQIDVNAVVTSINENIYTKINDYTNELIMFIDGLFNPVLSAIDSITELLNNLYIAMDGGKALIISSIDENVNGFANNAYSDITSNIAALNIDDSIKNNLYSVIENATIIPAANAVQIATNTTETTLSPVFNAMQNLINSVAMVRSQIETKQSEITAYIQTKQSEVTNAIHSLMTDLVNEAVKAWTDLLCTQTKEVTAEIKDSLDKQKTNLIELTETANTYSKIALSDVETKMVAKVVHTTVKPHIDALNTNAKTKLNEQKDVFVNSNLNDFFDVNQNVQDIKAKLDAGVETEKTSHFTITDINRILLNYFDRDYRVALMLRIMETDLNLDVSKITKK